MVGLDHSSWAEISRFSLMGVCSHEIHDELPVFLRVTQGSVLGPILFLLYFINGLLENFTINGLLICR